jgi:hypothetical protein
MSKWNGMPSRAPLSIVLCLKTIVTYPPAGKSIDLPAGLGRMDFPSKRIHKRTNYCLRTSTEYFPAMITPEQQDAIGEICRAFSRKLSKGSNPGPFLIELIKLFPDPSPLQKKIIKEIRRAFERAKEAEKSKPVLEEILTLLCGWGDTIEEPDVLDCLKAISEHGSYLRSR